MRHSIQTFCRPIVVTAGLAGALTLAAPGLFAQSSQRSSQQQDSQQQQQDSQQQQQDSQQQGARQNRSSADGGGQRSQQSRNQGQSQGRGNNQSQNRNQQSYQLDPEGWVRIAADYDNDGRYDAYEIIYVYDLQQAQQTSRQRSQRQAQGGQAQQSSRQSRAQQSGQRQQQGRQQQGQGSDQSVQGEITSLTSVRLAGSDQPRLVAKIESGQGRTRTVVLGPRSSLQNLQLQRGDQIQVRGKRARLNDREVLMATNVRHDGRSVSVDLPSRANLKRVKAELLSTREVRFRGTNEPYVVGQVRTRSGRQELVNFGPASKFNQLNVSNGDQLRLLVRQGRVSGQQALIAQEVSANGDRIRLSQSRDRFSRRQGSQSQGNQSRN